MTQHSSFAPERPVRNQPSEANQVNSLEASDLIVSYLGSLGIEYVFGIPGGAVEPLFNALARSQRRGGPRVIVARHESGAAFMADGYARETGKFGVCIATSGPGATNMITGVACAFDNSVPLLVLTGQPALPSFGRRSFQESGCTGVNVIGMFRHCTSYNSLISHPEQTEHKLVNALMRMHQTRRPAHLSLPVDVLRSPLPEGATAYDLPSLMKTSSLMDDLATRQLCDEIKAARKIAFIVGGGCLGAIESIMQLVELSGAIFVSAPDGKGLINPRHAAYRGVFGFAGHVSANEALGNSLDLIITIGTGMSEWNCAAWSAMVLNDRLIHMDSSAENLARTPMARLHVQGHIPSVCARLLKLLLDARRALPAADSSGEPHTNAAEPTPRPDQAPDNSAADGAPIKPQRLMQELSQRFPPTTRFLAEPGNSMNWAIHCLAIEDRRHNERRTACGTTELAGERRTSNAGWLSIAMDFCPMGWAIGAAVGVARANPRCPVVCITGDGSYLMNGQEITVAASEGLCVVFVILNDSALGMVKHGQRLTGAERIAFELPKVDFRLMAEAMGIPGHVINSPSDFAALDLAAILRRPGPTLLDVRIDGEEVPPMHLRTDALANT